MCDFSCMNDLWADANDEFKIRVAGSWDNEIYVRTETGWTATQNYGWKNGVQCIENIELTEQAKKVVVDGMLYIVRDGKLFNAQGAQVK